MYVTLRTYVMNANNSPFVISVAKPLNYIEEQKFMVNRVIADSKSGIMTRAKGYVLIIWRSIPSISSTIEFT